MSPAPSGLAAVQARIAQIQGTFLPYGAIAPSAAASSASTAGAARTGSTGTSFSSALQSATLGDGTASTSSVSTSALSGVTAPASATSAGLGERVVAAARQQIGTPYVWGGESPGGFDCSGLVQWAYKQVGVDLPRVSRDQAKVGREVSAADARPGDLVFFERGAVDHIGLYAGGGKWVVAPKTGDVVKVQDVDLARATTIRRIVPAGTASASGGPPYAALFSAAGAEHGVSPALLAAVARAESAFDPSARSAAGAQGLMQLMPATARGLGVDAWDPAQAVDGAARLLKQHLSRFGSTELALAAYNAGPGAVTRYGGVPPYAETQKYVAKIMAELRGTA